MGDRALAVPPLDLCDLGDVVPLRGIDLARLQPGVDHLLGNRGAGGAQRQREDVGVIPSPRSARGLGVAAERGADAGHVVGGEAVAAQLVDRAGVDAVVANPVDHHLRLDAEHRSHLGWAVQLAVHGLGPWLFGTHEQRWYRDAAGRPELLRASAGQWGLPWIAPRCATSWWPRHAGAVSPP